MIAAAANNYDANAKSASLHLLPRVTSVGPVSDKELVALYSDHMSRRGAGARAFYDKIMNATPNKRCPLCGIGTVKHLDHHLPKSKYPDLSILPTNLIPACHFCNDVKRSRFPASAEQQTFHPYYDAHLLAAQWVTATLNQGPPPVLVFKVNAPESWSQMDRARVAWHFAICGLATTFTSNANNQLSPLKERLRRLEARGGTSAVQAHLEEEAQSYSGRPNDWQHVTYRTLATDVWFVAGGFHSIP